jgi:putative transposase
MSTLSSGTLFRNSLFNMSEKFKIADQTLPYFVTFTVEAWVDVFTRQLYKDLLLDSILFCENEKGLIVYAWCLMTNHVHLIIGRKNAEQKIEDIIRDLKKYTSVHICRAIESNQHESRKLWMMNIFSIAADESRKHQKYKFWQDGYHPVELFTNDMIDQRLNYIHENPVRAGVVENAEDYLYSSARNYAGKKGLLEISMI